MGNSTSKTDATLIANAHKKDAASIISGGTAQPIGIIALPPHLQMSKTMSDDESSLLSATPSATPLMMPPQQKPLHQTIHRGLDAPLFEKERAGSRKKSKKKKWSLGARKRVLNNLRGVRNRASLLNRANNGDDKKNVKMKALEETVPSSLYIPRDDSWRSTGEGPAAKIGNPLTVDASQQLHLALPLVSPLPAPSSGLTPTYGVPQSPSSALKTQPLPLPSPQPSPRRSRHPMKQEANRKAKKSSKLPAKKKAYATSTKSSLYKKSQHDEDKTSATYGVFNNDNAVAANVSTTQGAWKPAHEKSGTPMIDLFASVEDNGGGKPLVAGGTLNVEEAEKRKEKSRPSHTNSFAASSSQSSKVSIFKGLKKQFTFKKREEAVRERAKEPVESGTSEMLKCAVALQTVTSSDPTEDLDQSRDGNVLGMMPNAPLNLSEIDLEASYTSNDRSFAESEAGVGNLDMGRLLGNIIEEDDEERLERDIDNEFLFLDDKEQDGRASGFTRSENVGEIVKFDSATAQLQSKSERIDVFDVRQKDTTDTPGAVSDDCSSVWNLSPIKLESVKTNKEGGRDKIVTNTAEKVFQRLSTSPTPSTDESSTVKIPAVSLNEVFAEMTISARTVNQGDDKKEPAVENVDKSSTSVAKGNMSGESVNYPNEGTSSKTEHNQEPNTDSLEASTGVVVKREAEREEAELRSSYAEHQHCVNNNSIELKTAVVSPPEHDYSSNNGDTTTKERHPGLLISTNELPVVQSGDNGEEKRLTSQEEQSCKSPNCEVLVFVDDENPQVPLEHEGGDDHSKNRQMVPSLPHDTPISLMSTSDSLNASIRRSSPRQAISKEAMFNASFLFSPNNEAFLARRSLQSRLPAIEDNFASMTTQPLEISKQHSTDSTVSGLSNVSSEGRLSTTGGFISPSTMNESESKKENKINTNSLGVAQPQNCDELRRDHRIGLEEKSVEDFNNDHSKMISPVCSSNPPENKGVGDDADSLFSTKSETKRESPSLEQSRENTVNRSVASRSSSSSMSKCSFDNEADREKHADIDYPTSILPLISPTSTTEVKSCVGEVREGEKRNDEQNEHNDKAQHEDILSNTDADLATNTSDQMEVAHEGTDNIKDYLPASLGTSQSETAHAHEGAQTCKDESDKPPVLLTPWKKLQEPDSVKTISPIRRFRSAKEKFSKQADNASQIKRAGPGINAQSSQQQSLVLSRVTEIDGRLRKNRQITKRNKRRDTSGGGVLAPRKATLVNPLFNRVPTVEESSLTEKDDHINSYDNNDVESIGSFKECAAKTNCDGIKMPESLDRGSDDSNEVGHTKNQTTDGDKNKLNTSTGDSVSLGRLEKEVEMNSMEEDKESVQTMKDNPASETINDEVYVSVADEKETTQIKSEEICISDSPVVPEISYADKYLSLTSELLPHTETNYISAHVDTPRMTNEAGGFDDIIDGSNSVDLVTAQERSDEESLSNTEANYADKYLSQTSCALSQAAPNSTNASLFQSPIMSHNVGYNDSRQCDSPGSYTCRDTSLLSIESDDVFATLAKCHDEPGTHNQSDSSDLALPVTENHPPHSDEISLQQSTYGSDPTQRISSTSSNGMLSQIGSTPNGSQEDKENFSPHPESGAGKAANISFVSQTDLCLSPVQRTSQQARKWRTLAAAAAANKNSTKRAARKKGRKKKQKKSLTKSRSKAAPLAPVLRENVVN